MLKISQILLSYYRRISLQSKCEYRTDLDLVFSQEMRNKMAEFYLLAASLISSAASSIEVRIDSALTPYRLINKQSSEPVITDIFILRSANF